MATSGRFQIALVDALFTAKSHNALLASCACTIYAGYPVCVTCASYISCPARWWCGCNSIHNLGEDAGGLRRVDVFYSSEAS